MSEDIQIFLDSIQGVELFYQIITTGEIGTVLGVLAYLLLRAEKRIVKILKEFIRNNLETIVEKQLKKIVLSEPRVHEADIKEVLQSALNTNEAKLKEFLQDEINAHERRLKEFLSNEQKRISGMETYMKRLKKEK